MNQSLLTCSRRAPAARAASSGLGGAVGLMTGQPRSSSSAAHPGQEQFPAGAYDQRSDPAGLLPAPR